MAKKRAKSPEWGVRLRAHVKATGQKWGDIAERLEVAESTIRSWTNGTREVGIPDFMRLCAAAGADPSMVLVGRPALTAAQWDALQRLVLSPHSSNPACRRRSATAMVRGAAPPVLIRPP